MPKQRLKKYTGCDIFKHKVVVFAIKLIFIFYS